MLFVKCYILKFFFFVFRCTTKSWMEDRIDSLLQENVSVPCNDSKNSCTLHPVLLWFFGCRNIWQLLHPTGKSYSFFSLSFTHCHWRIDFSLLYSNLSQFILDCSVWNILISYHTAIQLTIPFLTCHQGNSVACFLLAIKFLFHMLVALNVCILFNPLKYFELRICFIG